MNYTRDLIAFNTKAFDFRSMVLSHINKSLVDESLPPVARLEQLHEVQQISHNLEIFRQRLFQLFRHYEFQELYRDFVKHLIETHFDTAAVVQKTPTVRIQLVNGNSVSFHSDAWYGHGQNVNSFWLPLTQVAGNNSLQIARTRSDSVELLNSIEQEQLDLDEINFRAGQICEPITANFGDLIVFNGDMIHGTLRNNTDATRVSFDFRIAHSLSDIGNKPKANFFTYDELSVPMSSPESDSITIPAKKAIMYSGKCGAITAKNQLVFLNEYARLNNIKIIGSESEIVVFDYAPVLQKYTTNPGLNIDCVLLFSIELLPKERSIRERIYQQSMRNGVQIVFAAEEIVLENSESIRLIEDLLLQKQHSLIAA